MFGQKFGDPRLNGARIIRFFGRFFLLDTYRPDVSDVISGVAVD